MQTNYEEANVIESLKYRNLFVEDNRGYFSIDKEANKSL